MIRYFLVLLVVMTTFNAFSQINSTYNYSFGIKGYNYQQMPKVLDQANAKTYISSTFNNYFVKFNDHLLSYRVSGGYIQKSFSFNNICNNCELVSGTISDFVGKVGVEKSFNYSIIQPYAGFDVGYRSNKFEGISQNINSLKQQEAVSTNRPLPQSSVLTTKEGLMISPVAGLKVSPVKQLSLFVEASLDFFYSYERQELVTQDVYNERTLNKFHKAESLLNPISVGLQFNFGSK